MSQSRVQMTSADGIGGAEPISQRTQEDQARVAKPVPSLDNPAEWREHRIKHGKEADPWPSVDDLGSARLLDIWGTWIETDIKRQERVVGRYDAMRAGALGALPFGVASVALSLWAAQEVAGGHDGLWSILACTAVTVLLVYFGVWGVHEWLPQRKECPRWTSWQQDKERLIRLEETHRKYAVARLSLDASMGASSSTAQQ